MPTYQRGDFVKVEFADETTGIGEWMWVRVQRCDDAPREGARLRRRGRCARTLAAPASRH